MNKAAITNKLQATKVNVSSAAKAKFSQKQALRTESFRKITAVAKEKIARASQKVSSFKPIREIPKDATHSGVFHREVEWTAQTDTKQTYKVTQRSNIDWSMTMKDNFY
ncbi:MAG: hypothetical protein LBK24_01180 [Puniceicoccales bacterium]|nr:hypothetical protein [Puniceicoccales bacterium]